MDKGIAPSTFILIWRIIHGKLVTDEQLLWRGHQFPLMCSICKSFLESITHLFFDCLYAMKLWASFSTITRTHRIFSLFSLFLRSWWLFVFLRLWVWFFLLRNCFWLERDFMLVILSFDNPDLVPWKVRNCWY